MGLSRKKESTNLVKLRVELNRLNVKGETSDGLSVQQKEADHSVGRSVSSVAPLRGSLCELGLKQAPVAGSGVSTGALIKEAKKRGRRKNELVDGSRLMTC